MAKSVPYEQYPTAQPIPGTGARAISIAAPGEAFGTSIAQATEHLGGVLEHAGDEIYARAQAMQQLKNESEAKEADAQYMIEVGKMHANYSSLQGKAAVDANPKYNQDLQDLRQKMRAGLSNDMSRRMFDANSLSTMGHTIFNGAGHAATQGKVYAAKTSEARVDAMKDQALSTPEDDVAFRKSITGAMAEVDQQGDLGGWGPEQIARNKGLVESGLWSNRIVGLARTKPFEAKAMLAKATAEQKIRGQDLEAVKRHVDDQVHTVGARNIADAVNPGWAPYMKQDAIDRAVGIEPSLTAIVKEAQRAHPELQFTIPSQGGRRSPEEQADLVRRGFSHTMHSNHLTGRGVDLVPLDASGKPDFNDRAAYGKIETAMKEASHNLGIPIGDEHDKISSWDPGHYSLPREYNVADAPKVAPEPLASRVDRAVQYARKVAPEDSVFADLTRDRVRGDFQKAQADKRDFDFTNTNTIANALVGGVDGKMPTTVEALVALSPEVAQAWDNLDPTKKRTYLTQMAARAGEKPVRWSEEGLRRWNDIVGMSDDDHKVDEFLAIDPVAEKLLPDGYKVKLGELQRSRLKVGIADPSVSQAMTTLEGSLEAAGMTRTKDPERYYNFRGALSGAMQSFQDANKRKPKEAEVHEIGSRLLQEMHTHFWQASQLRFEIPADLMEEIKADLKASLNKEATDAEVYRLFTLKTFQELYGKKEATK